MRLVLTTYRRAMVGSQYQVQVHRVEGRSVAKQA